MQVVAISYDPLKVLQEFGKRKRILYPLLSDPKSKTIGAYGIRNKEMAGKRFDGVPYPGTFIVDTNGIVREKLFYKDYKKRHLAKDIVKGMNPVRSRTQKALEMNERSSPPVS